MKKLLTGLFVLAAALPAQAEEITYAKHIKPVWEDQCGRCHDSSAPTYEVYMADPKKYDADDKGPRMDTYETLVFFLNGEKEAGALMRRLDDGANAKDGQAGNMYRHLGRSEKRKENLQLFKKWVGEDAWTTKKTAELTKDDLQKIKAPR
ncbi:MAG: cytochrome C [Betaproteobacteria bacterium]|nr:cytochrome C [Betaproteobacteria bacterium]